MNQFGASPLLAGCNFALVAIAAWLAWCGAGRLVAKTRLGRRPHSEQCLLAGVLTLSWVLAGILALGAVHLLGGWSAWTTLLPLAAFDGAQTLRRTAHPDPVRSARRRLGVLLAPRNPRARGLPTLGAWLCVAAPLVALAAGWVWPRADYDALSYHLPFTAAAIDGAGAIPFVDTPFGDSAQAYQPKNDGLLRLALAPLPGVENLLRLGAWPHLPLLLLAVYVAARALGARRSHATLGAATTALLGPVVLAQAESAMVDLAFASPWFAAIAISCANTRAAGRRATAPAFGAGLAAGLAFGAKFLAVPYAALLGLVLVRFGPRGIRAWLAFGVGCSATGAYFYVRNALWTGNPLYPIELSLPGGGPTLLAGNYGRAEMLDWVYAFRTRPEPLPVRVAMFTHDLFGYAPRLGPTSATTGPLIAPLAIWLVGLARCLWPGARTRPATLIVILTPLTLALCWWVVPYNYGRFAIPALAAIGVGVALMPHRGHRRARGNLGFSCILGLIGVHVLLLTWLGQGADALLGDHRTWSIALAVTGIAGAAWWPRLGNSLDRAAPGRALPRLAFASAALLGVGTALTSLRQDTPAAPEPWPEAAAAATARTGTIAYAGTNLPSPLRRSSDGAPRSVIYIPLDGRRERFDQRARRWHEDGLPAAVCPEPVFYRRHRDPRAWLGALIGAGVETLFVARLTGVQRLNIEHDADGFPIERTWADRLLAPIRTTEAARVYAVPESIPIVPGGLAGPERQWPDVFWLRARDRASALQRFPLAAEELAAGQFAAQLHLAAPLHQRTIDRARER